ncbi:MBL fold metallo-hydrolase [Intestinibacter sp.]|uniref:MBL fold metallo-hydrolase n=1 Tax=Intestinibacter sp. TaxID=1965304 RepID=UPI002A75F1ED|nr:MBL fold metallo-hydrolase [Intestinibacter sp.]MDY2737400.1 MBL fold metallo-hydrolase [Intestinibacter sp.]
MGIELIMLGTGHAMVTKCYNTCFLLKKEDEYLMVDSGGGNGIMSQLEKLGVSYTDIHNLIVTHGHTDHILGAIWIIRKIAMMMTAKQYPGKFTIYCHDEVVKTIQTFCELLFPKKFIKFIGDGIYIQEVTDGEQLDIMGIKTEFFDIQSTKKKQFGFKFTFDDGKTLACLGDEPYNEANKQYIQNCDWMLSEAYCLYADREKFKPYKKHHSTALDAGKCAEKLNIKNLLLYHTEDTNLENRKKLYTDEAKSVFSGNVFVPYDLEKIRIK